MDGDALTLAVVAAVAFAVAMPMAAAEDIGARQRQTQPTPHISWPPIGHDELMAEIEAFERAIEGQPREVVQRLLREQVVEFKGRTVEVSDARVTSTYTRENPSHIYFGFNYDPNDHLFLSEIDPPLHESLTHHRLWASVAKTTSSRQVSYELPIDAETFNLLESGMQISFSCRIAALIRGRSVYCAPGGLEIVIAAGPAHPS